MGFRFQSDVDVNEDIGWRFFLKPAGLELFFLETGTYLYFLLFIFLYFPLSREVSAEDRFKKC